MKKVILFLLMLVSFGSAAFADEIIISHQYVVESQKKIDEVGFNILNSNGIEKRMVFDFNTKKVKNAVTNNNNRQITIYRSLFDRLKTDDELAAVLAHEISHGVDSYNGILRGSFSGLSYLLSPKKYEYKADKRAVDYMVNAGYNPVAMIVVFNKSFPQNRFDWNSTHPLTSRRMMEVYEYIYKKYPEYLANNKYKNDIFYQNFLLTSKANRAKFQNKVETKSKKKVHYL